MNKELPETILRRIVKQTMAGTWEMTWHEDRVVSPGVPDISFVMMRNDCETGWLELKAIAETEKAWRFKLEPSQPQWFDRHMDRIPVFILVAVGETCWLLRSHSYRALQASITRQMLDQMCLAQFTFKTMRTLMSQALTQETSRNRNGQICRI